jgi:hypothetical protein
MLVLEVWAFREATMCKSLVVAMLCLAFAFANSTPVAARTGIGGNVPLTKEQVATVCGDKSYCEKPCGANSEYTCGFGCGSKGCSGSCTNCPQRIGPTKLGPIVRAPITGAMKAH